MVSFKYQQNFYYALISHEIAKGPVELLHVTHSNKVRTTQLLRILI